MKKELEFPAILDRLRQGVLIIGYDWHVHYCNTTVAEYVQKQKSDFEHYPVAEMLPDILNGKISDCMNKRTAEEFEMEYPAGSKRYFDITIMPSENTILIQTLDVSLERKKEIKSNKIRNLYALISQVNQSIIHTDETAMLLSNACRIANEFGKFKIVWIGICDSETKLTSPAAMTGITHEEILLQFGSENKNDLVQDYVLKNEDYYLCNRIEPKLPYWDHFTKKHEINSYLVLPIKKSGCIYGTLNLYSSEKDYFEREEIDLLKELAGDISLGIALLDKEKVYAESESFNRGVLNSLDSNIAVIDDSGTIIAVNNSWEKFAIENGASALSPTGIGANYYSVCKNSILAGELNAEEALRGMEKVMHGEELTFYQEYSCYTHAGKKWFAMRALKFDSKQSLVVVSHTNISERKLAEKKLIQSQTRLNEAQAISHIGHWEVNFDTNIALWSEEYCRIFGLAPDENIQHPETWLSFIHPDDIDDVMSGLNEMSDSKNFIVINHRIVLRNGTMKHIEAKCKLETDQSGKPVRIYGIGHDITEIKNAKLVLEKQNEELLKTNAELDRFVYSVSHELRSPLTSIMGLIFFIEKESKEKFTIEYAGMIRTSIRRLDEFIKNILNYSRNNQAELIIEKIDVKNAVAEIIDSIRNMKEAEGISFEVNFDEQAPFYTDKIRFTIVMENLISNSVRYHKKEAAVKYVRINGYADKDEIRIKVEDNGIGIAPEYYDKIFEMFYRLSGKTTGSGIGLYIVKETLNKIHGSIDLVSDSDGTVFSLIIRNMSVQ